jgi:hypothetical protein
MAYTINGNDFWDISRPASIAQDRDRHGNTPCSQSPDRIDADDSVDRALAVPHGDGDVEDANGFYGSADATRSFGARRTDDENQRRLTACLVFATVAFFAVAIGIGAANYYSPLMCFGQRYHIEEVVHPTPTHHKDNRADDRYSWIVLASAFFACGTTSLVVVGLVVIGLVGCAGLSLRVSRVLACVI